MIENIKEYNDILYTKLFGKTSPFFDVIHDQEVEQFIEQISWDSIMSIQTGKQAFLNKAHEWITNNPQYNKSGLDRFEERHIISSPFDAITEAFLRYGQTRKFRHLRGEYCIAMMNDHIYFPQHHYTNVRDSRGGSENKLSIDNMAGKYFDLDRGDWTLMSLPFYGTGDRELMFDGALNQAKIVNAPVVLDCSLFSYSENINYDFHHTGISEVIFNLSLGLGLPNNTLGIRYSNNDSGLISDHYHKNWMLPSTLSLASYLMECFPSNYFATKYRQFRNDICKDFGFTPTNVVNLCLASWDDEYWREDEGVPYPTVNISKALTRKLQGKYNV